MKDTTPHTLTRREFVAKSALAAATTQFLTFPVFGQNAPSNKLKLAGVGVGGMGFTNLKACTSEDIVALCDVDVEFTQKVREMFPQAHFYVDYKEMLEKEDDLDGVVIGSPDHTHANISLACMNKGLHVFTQKPLTHTVYEARKMTEAAAAHPELVTQMGNQGKSFESMQVIKEWVDAGAIGNVTEVHAWTDRPVGGDPWSTFPVIARPEETPPVPSHLDWERWIGPAPMRPYHPIYHPMSWRGFYDFGTGPLGDMGCHILDPSFYVLDLGAPDVVEATSTHWEEHVQTETYPRATRVRYHFPARGSKPPVTINWSDGRLLPFRPKGVPNDLRLPGSGAIWIGDEGVLMHGSHGARGVRLIPESKMRSFLQDRPKPYLRRVKGSHEADWISAVKGGDPCLSPFSYGGPLTEMVLLGVLAIRVPNQRLEWNAKTMSFGHAEADALVNPPKRKGWELPV